MTDTSTQAVEALVMRAIRAESSLDASTGWVEGLWEVASALAAERDALKAALSALTEEYVLNVDRYRTGGFSQDPEEEKVVIEARAALEATS